MKKFLLILILNFLLSGNVYSKDYKVGEQIENNVELDKILSIDLSSINPIIETKKAIEIILFKSFSEICNK